MDAVRSVAEVAARVSALQGGVPFIVGIDGLMGSGKSTLAESLSSELGWRRFAFDDYLDPTIERLGYVASLRMAELSASWRSHRADSSPLIAEGACLREILYSLGDGASAHVYSKCLSAQREYWDEGDEVWAFIHANGAQGVIPPLSRSLLEYHAKWKPHEKANVYYEWLDRDSHDV